ncbi:RNase T domain containing protein [Trichuris trichiura]|uniref:RNase T domain containing protein n=1 Tax=Trichuris trichiura TaxID=36087 RepID=A0A077Z6M3_TRITR|nr:RNase T domain containing protein [Trichuris trichiura]
MKERKRPLNSSEESALQRSGKKVIRSIKDVLYDYYCVIDFECTCEEYADIRTYPHEIIEFPAILIDSRTRLEVDEFHSYCRPVENPRLSQFCVSLTGIHQETVDKAPLFEDVVNDFQAWLARHVDNANKTVAFVVDGINQRLLLRQPRELEPGECTDDDDDDNEIEGELVPDYFFVKQAKSILKYGVVPVSESDIERSKH